MARRKKVKLTSLGSMGWIPVRDRHTCCYCLEYQETLIIFDAGTGMARFNEPWGQDILQRYQKVLLLLSHYHLDHVAGLIYLPYFFKDKEVHIAGPGLSIYDENVKQILMNLIRPPYFNRPITEFPMELSFSDLQIGPSTIAGVTVDAIIQEHSDPSVGIKIENTVCYLTDTVCKESTVNFARHCRILLHETWLDVEEYRDLQEQVRLSSPSLHAQNTLRSHSPVHLVAETAHAASVEKLLLIHLNPSYDENRLLAMEKSARQIFPDSQLAKEGYTIELM